MKRILLSACLVLVASAVRASVGLPPLVGDGQADDTAAIQARLDAGTSCVYLPPPRNHYVISKTLKIGSDQELRLDRFTRIRLAPKSDCPLVENRCYVAGTGTNANIAVTGGVWDMDNLRQTPNNMQTPEGRKRIPKVHTPGYFWGMAMRFCHVEGITVKDVTIRNPTTYGIEFGHVSNFLVSDIVFDYKTWNPIPLNMDGVHFDGFCHHGKVMNLRGTCFDDLIALNANDGVCSPEEGPITDVDIDGLYADYCHSAARILSAGADIRRITIRNVHGHFYCYTVGLTHYFPQKPRGRFDDIVIEDVFAAKALVPPECGGQSYRGPMEIVHLQGPIDVGNLVVSRLYRDESCLPTATIGIDAQATVENLAVRDCRMTNRLAEPIEFIRNRGKVQKLVNENNTFVGAWKDARSFTFASWNVGHFALGLSQASTIPESSSEAKGREFRKFLDEVNADVLGVCEFSESFATNGAVPSAQAVFAGYDRSVVGPSHAYQWNAQFLRAGTILGTRVHEYATHAQGVYWLETRVRICGEEVVFVETHLDWCSPEVRSTQMRELVDRFKDEPRVVIAGDFNQGIRYLDHSKPDVDNPVEYRVFADAGFTLGNDGRYKTHPPENPYKSLDNIIVKGLKLRNFRVWMRGDLSDHALVSAELEIER